MLRKTLAPHVAAVALAIICTTLVPSTTQAAGLLVADGGFGGVLEIKEHDVNVTVNNGIAVTEVNQVFTNTENRIVEALYTFPVPKGASVANFSMWINGKEMIGEVVEKKRARQIYESYKQTRTDPGLLEQVNYKTFEMRIFPIAAGAEQRVRVTYYQELDYDHDWATYVYPLATTTRTDIDQQTTGKFALSLDVKSEIPIVAMESTSHSDDFVIAKHSDQYHQASLETSAGDLSRDVVLAYQVQRPRSGLDIIASKQSGEDGYFMLTLTAGEELAAFSQGMDYVFILDVSGSMARDGKLRLSRNSLGAFVEGLGPEDRFEVIAFNVAPNTLFNSLKDVDDASMSEARQFLESQRARGGTSLRPAINAAYRYLDADRTLNVIVLSDGMTEQSEQQELIQLISQRPSGSRVFCIGVGNEVNRPLLKQLADNAGGLAAFASQGDNLERQALAFRRKLMRPAMTQVKISFEGGNVYDVEPKELPNLYHGAPLRMYGRYKQAGPVSVRVQADIEGAAFVQNVELVLPSRDDANPHIERMWAWHNVQRLMGKSRKSGGANSDLETEIVRLCEGYSIVSEYASFIVLENDAEYRRWKIDQRNATRIQRDRQARAALRKRFSEIRETALADMGPGTSTEEEQITLAPEISSNTPGTATRPAAPASTRDLNIRPPTGRRSGGGGGMGGGAIDPITGAIALGLAGAAAAAGRRRRKPRVVQV